MKVIECPTFGNLVTFNWNIVVPDTRILFGRDGNGNFILQDGDDSSSGSITFVFVAVANGQSFAVDGFECQLDNVEL